MADGQPLKKPPGFADPVKPPPPMGPRKPAVPPTFYQTKKKRRSCCRICCCFICFLILIIIIFLGVAIAIFYLWFQPKMPVFRLRPVEMDRFNITIKPDKTTLLDSQTVIRVEVKNPNGKLRIYYGETGVTLTVDQETQLGTATIPAFRQPTNNVTVLKFTAEVDNQVIDETTASALKKRMESQQVEVDAEVKTKVGLGIGSWKIGMLPVTVNCGGVTLKQLNDGNSNPKCSFHTLRWIAIH